MGECKGTVYARCCHWLATSAALTAEEAAWPTTQASGDGRRRPPVTLQSEYKPNLKKLLSKNLCQEKTKISKNDKVRDQ